MHAPDAEVSWPEQDRYDVPTDRLSSKLDDLLEIAARPSLEVGFWNPDGRPVFFTGGTGGTQYNHDLPKWLRIKIRPGLLPKGGRLQLDSFRLYYDGWTKNPVWVSVPRWSQETVQRGDILTLSAEARGAPDGERAVVRIFQEAPRGEAHKPVTRLRPRVEKGAVEVMYQFQYPGDTADIVPEWEAPEGYAQPRFFYTVDVLGVQADSTDAKAKGLLTFVDDATIRLRDLVTDAPVADETVVVILPDGSEQETTLDAEGRAELSDIPPGPIKYFFPDLPGSSRESPLQGTTGPDPNEASLWRIAPQQTVMAVDHETGGLDTSTEPLQEGTWVYVFPEHSGEDPPMSPIIEAKATGEGTLMRVDWSDPSR